MKDDKIRGADAETKRKLREIAQYEGLTSMSSMLKVLVNRAHRQMQKDKELETVQS